RFMLRRVAPGRLRSSLHASFVASLQSRSVQRLSDADAAPCGDPPESYSTVHQYDVGHRKGAAANEAGRADQLSAMPFWMRSITEESASVVTSPTSRFSATDRKSTRLNSSHVS